MSNLIAVLLLFNIFLAVPALLSALADAKIDSMNSAELIEREKRTTPPAHAQPDEGHTVRYVLPNTFSELQLFYKQLREHAAAIKRANEASSSSGFRLFGYERPSQRSLRLREERFYNSAGQRTDQLGNPLLSKKVAWQLATAMGPSWGDYRPQNASHHTLPQIKEEADAAHGYPEELAGNSQQTMNNFVHQLQQLPVEVQHAFLQQFLAHQATPGETQQHQQLAELQLQLQQQQHHAQDHRQHDQMEEEDRSRGKRPMHEHLPPENWIKQQQQQQQLLSAYPFGPSNQHQHFGEGSTATRAGSSSTFWDIESGRYVDQHGREIPSNMRAATESGQPHPNFIGHNVSQQNTHSEAEQMSPTGAHGPQPQPHHQLH